MTLRPFTKTLLAAALALAALPAAADTVLISAERLLDVRTGKWIENPEILVRDGKIARITRGPGEPVADEPTRK